MVLNYRTLVMQHGDCDRCAGCGYITDGENPEPFKYWLELPVQSAVALQIGLVNPVECPSCKGSGSRCVASAEQQISGGEVMTDSQQPKEYLLQFFAYDHLPPDLQQHSRPFCELAFKLVETLPRNPERTVALRKLLEAKDCAVRARLFKQNE